MFDGTLNGGVCGTWAYIDGSADALCHVSGGRLKCYWLHSSGVCGYIGERNAQRLTNSGRGRNIHSHPKMVFASLLNGVIHGKNTIVDIGATHVCGGGKAIIKCCCKNIGLRHGRC